MMNCQTRPITTLIAYKYPADEWSLTVMRKWRLGYWTSEADRGINRNFDGWMERWLDACLNGMKPELYTYTVDTTCFQLIRPRFGTFLLSSPQPCPIASTRLCSKTKNQVCQSFTVAVRALTQLYVIEHVLTHVRVPTQFYHHPLHLPSESPPAY